MSQPKADNWDALVVQAVAAYPSADDARKFFAASTERWSKCTNRLTMPISQDPAGKLCQHALSVDGNIIVDVSACNQSATDQGAQIAQKIEDRVPH
jgi:serine/threonine-protein kinase